MDKDRSEPAKAAVAGQVDQGVRRHLRGWKWRLPLANPHQARTMLCTGDGYAPEERGHWYSPDAVREFVAEALAEASRAASGAADTATELAAQQRAGE
jgi:hypothetical protein